MDAGAQINVLAGLEEAEVQRLEAICRTTTHEADEAIFREGDEGDDLFIVRSGRVRISKAISLDVDRTLTMLGPGGVFGELAMVGEGNRSATAQALEATTVLALSREVFQTLLAEEPVLGLKVMGRFAAMLAERLRVTTDLLRDTVHWAHEVSGAAALDLHRLIEVHARLDVSLVNGERVVGRLIQVDRSESGTFLSFSGADGTLHVVPYHALVAIRLGKDILQPEED